MSAFAAFNNSQQWTPDFPEEVSPHRKQQRSFVQIRNDNVIFSDDAVYLGLRSDECVLIHGFYVLTVLRGNIVVDDLYKHGSGLSIPIVTTSLDPVPLITCTVSSDATEHQNILPQSPALLKIENLDIGLLNVSEYENSLLAKLFYKSISEYTFEIISDPDQAWEKFSIMGAYMESGFGNTVRKVTQNMCREHLVLKSSAVVITGSKTTGKSTLSAYIANSMLASGFSKVAYMDLDPDLSPFSPPGVISVSLYAQPCYGAQWVRRPVEEFSHFYGFFSPLRSPERFLQLFKDLKTHYDTNWGDFPLIVNTSGLIKGYGNDIIKEILSLLNPKDLVFMAQAELAAVNDDIDEETGEFIDATVEEIRLLWQHSRLHSQRAVRRIEPLRRSELYDLAYLLHFHHSQQNQWVFDPHIIHNAPFVLSLDQTKPICLAAIHSLHEINCRPTKDNIVTFTEATIMALCASQSLPNNTHTIEGIEFGEDPDFTLQFITLCMVHSVDLAARSIYVYFPLGNWSNSLDRYLEEGYKLILVRGEGRIPTAEMQPPTFSGTEIPFLVGESTSRIGGIWKVRRNGGRKNQK